MQLDISSYFQVRTSSNILQTGYSIYRTSLTSTKKWYSVLLMIIYEFDPLMSRCSRFFEYSEDSVYINIQTGILIKFYFRKK